MVRRWRSELRTEERVHPIDGPVSVGRVGSGADLELGDGAIARLVPVEAGTLVEPQDPVGGWLIDDRRVDFGLIPDGATVRIGTLRLVHRVLPGEPLEPVEPHLEAQLAGGAGPLAAWLVYADWLSARGHPRGELIVVQHRLEAGRDLALERRQDQLIRQLGHGWIELERGRWRRGFLRGIDLIRPDALELARALGHPSARFLEELTWIADAVPPSRSALRWLGALLPRTSVRRLGVHGVGVDAFAPLRAAMPALVIEPQR
jgi:uncharacterized protein (TIGR02996 family)